VRGPGCLWASRLRWGGKSDFDSRRSGEKAGGGEIGGEGCSEGGKGERKRGFARGNGGMGEGGGLMKEMPIVSAAVGERGLL